MTATFNYDPYYDDFNEDKNFMRVLFRPGYSVQARELTQLQTILSNQIEKFGNHIFKSGSPVYGGKVFLDPNANYVKLQTQYNGTDIDANEFLGKTVVSYSGGSIVRAKVVAIDTTGTNPVLVLKYVSGERFLAGDTIRVYRQEIFATLAVTDAVGQSLIATITEGVYYFKGQFVSVSPQTIIIETYYKLGYNSQASGAALNWKIGIEFEEQIIDEIDDVALLDPAQGAFNYQAPGANRFKITTTLSKRTLNNADTSRFFEIVRLVNGVKTKEIEYPIYSDIEKTLARRTYDESGNYTVDPFVISLEEGDSANGKFNAVLDPGKAYVSGYEFQTIAPTVLEINRARSTLSVQEKPIPLFYESSVVLGNVRNTLDITAFPTLDIHCVDHANVNVVTSVAYNSTKIGTVKASMIRFNDSIDSGNGDTYTLTTNLFEPQTANISGTLAGSGHSTTIIAIPATFDNSLPTNAYANMYFRITSGTGVSIAPIPISSSNITHLTLSTALPYAPNSNTFSIDSDFKNTKSLVQTGGSFPSNWIKFAGNIDNDSKILATGDSYISEPAASSLIFESSFDAIKEGTISNCDFVVRKLYSPAASDAAGLITINSDTVQHSDSFGWYPTTVGANITGSLINQNIVCFVRADSNTSSTLGIKSNTILALSNSNFLLKSVGANTFTANVGIAGVKLDMIVSTQINNAESTSGTPYFRNKTLAPSIAGVDLHAKVPFEMGGGDTLENANTVTNTSFTGGVVFEDVGATNFTETAILKDLRTPGKEVSLQVPDVYQIVRITDSKSLTTNVTTAMLTSSGYDVTSSYEFNNGQKKSYYDHSTIRLKRGYSAPTGRIFVQYKYLKHSATTGFFTVDSYIRPSSNVSYSGISVFQNLEDKRIVPLRGTFDFRPSKAIGGTSLGYALNPDPFTQIKPNFEYYLGRIDQIVVKSTREFAVINGNPAISPTPPSVKNEDMLIYTLFIPAYTESVKDIRADFHNHRRYTMGDLQAFDDRISGIEYYVSLTTLEKDAASTKILDANLNDRSKYGIVVDNFTSTINQISARSGATDNSNLIENKTLKPASLMRTVKMDFTGSSGASLVKGVGNKKLLMVNYSSTMPLATQPYATKAIAVQTAFIGAFPGKLNLYPEFTAAVDTSVTSKVVLNSSQGLDTAFNFINDSFKYISDKEPTWANDKDSPFSKTADAKYYQTRREAGALSGVVALTGEYFANGLINQDFGQIQAYNDNSYLTAGATFNQKQITTSTTQVDMGNYVTDLAIQPYMKPSRILFSASGLRPATIYFNFFDNVDVNKYIIVPNKITLNANTTIVSGERLLLANSSVNLQAVKTYYTANNTLPGFNTWLEQNSIIVVVSEQNSANISVINETEKTLTGSGANLYFYAVDSAKYYNQSGTVGSDDHRSGVTRSVSSTTIQLAADAPAVNIAGSTITLIHKAGNGSLDMEGFGGQFVVSAYNTTTKVATVVLENQFSLYPYVVSNWVYSIGSNKSNKLGQIGGAFYMPLATFRSGERNFRVTESFNNTYDTEALSYADKTFVSSGIQLKKTNLVETVFNTNIETKIVGTVTSDRLLGSRAAGTEIVNRTTTSYAPPPPEPAPAGDGCCGGDGGGGDPLAQTFFVDPQVYPYGTFVDNVDLFFRGKDDENLPVGIHLRPTINSQISEDFFIPDSVVFKYPNEVNVSENPDAANTQTITNFKFSNPVYLKPGMYGLLVYTSSPDYTIWQSEKGKVSTSGQLIDKQPYVGTLYRAQESMSLEFSQRINEDLMFKINRCVFDTNQTATFTLTNQQPEKYFGVDKIRLIETSIKPSERENSLVYSIAANTVMGIKEASSRTVLPGVVYGFSTDTLYRVGDRRKKIEYTSDLDLNITLSTSRNDVTPFVSLESLHFNVWENFVDNAELSVNDFIITASGTGYSNSNVVQVISSTGSGANVQIQTDSNGNIVSFLVHSGGTNYIDDYTITIGANTSYPNTAAVGTGAEINSNSEYDPTGGPVQAKYITKPIGLADGYDAGDLRVYLTANKPGETEVTVFYKILSGTDSTSFDDRPYEKLVCINPTSSPSIDEVTYREYEYRPSAILNAITYIGTNGVTYDTFKTFAIKIVMTSTDPAIVPSVKDLRIIAIPAE